MKYKILVVDDDKELVKMLCSYFNMKQYETITATDGMEALNKIKMKPDIILLDINMPRMDGIEVCRLIRSKVLCPILFLTARVDEDDKINGLLSGGDDYITKPFSMPILLRKIAAVLRRSNRNSDDNVSIHYKDLILDLDGYKVYIKNVEYDLTQREFEVLRELLYHQGKVLSRQYILNTLWKYDFYGDERVVDTHIKNLRKKLNIDYIETIRGVGYKIEKEM